MTSSIGKAADFGTGLALAGYLALVIYNKNMKTLAGDAVQDYGYLEWLVAIALIYFIYKSVDNKVVAWLIILTVIAAGIKFLSANQGVLSSIQNFAQGKQGLFATITGQGTKQNTPQVQTTATPAPLLPATQTTPAVTSA